MKQVADDEIGEDFFSKASHDLNTPLSALGLQLALIKRMAEKLGESELACQVNRYAEQSLISVQNVSTLLNEFMDLIQIRLGHLKMRKEIYNLVDLVKESIAQVHVEVAHSGSQVLVQSQVAVTGMFDRIRLGQAVSYFISHAIQYGKDQSIQVLIEDCGVRAKIVIQCTGDESSMSQWKWLQWCERVENDAAIPELKADLVHEIIKAHAGVLRVEQQGSVGVAVIIELLKNTD